MSQFLLLTKQKHNDPSAAVTAQKNGLLNVSYTINGKRCETKDVSMGTLRLLNTQLEGLDDACMPAQSEHKLQQLSQARKQRQCSQAIRKDGMIKHLTLVVRESGYPAFKIRYPKKTHISISDDNFTEAFRHACEKVQATLDIPLKTLLKSEKAYFKRYLSLFQ